MAISTHTPSNYSTAFRRKKFPPIYQSRSISVNQHNRLPLNTVSNAIGLDQSHNQILEKMKAKSTARVGNHKVSHFYYKDGCYMSKVDRLPSREVLSNLFEKIGYQDPEPSKLGKPYGSVFGQAKKSSSSVDSLLDRSADPTSTTITTSTSPNQNLKLSRQINKIAAEKVIRASKHNKDLSVNGLNFGKTHSTTMKFGRFGRSNLIGHYGKEAVISNSTMPRENGNLPRNPNAAEIGRFYKKQKFEKDIIPATCSLDFNDRLNTMGSEYRVVLD